MSDDLIMRAISYEPWQAPGVTQYHYRWRRIELAYGRPFCSPSVCVQGFTFWLGDGALHA